MRKLEIFLVLTILVFSARAGYRIYNAPILLTVEIEMIQEEVERVSKVESYFFMAKAYALWGIGLNEKAPQQFLSELLSDSSKKYSLVSIVGGNKKLLQCLKFFDANLKSIFDNTFKEDAKTFERCTKLRDKERSVFFFNPSFSTYQNATNGNSINSAVYAEYTAYYALNGGVDKARLGIRIVITDTAEAYNLKIASIEGRERYSNPIILDMAEGLLSALRW